MRSCHAYECHPRVHNQASDPQLTEISTHASEECPQGSSQGMKVPNETCPELMWLTTMSFCYFPILLQDELSLHSLPSMASVNASLTNNHTLGWLYLPGWLLWMLGQLSCLSRLLH